jgi:hypothetical protein
MSTVRPSDNVVAPIRLGRRMFILNSEPGINAPTHPLLRLRTLHKRPIMGSPVPVRVPRASAGDSLARVVDEGINGTWPW